MMTGPHHHHHHLSAANNAAAAVVRQHHHRPDSRTSSLSSSVPSVTSHDTNRSAQVKSNLAPSFSCEFCNDSLLMLIYERTEHEFYFTESLINVFILLSPVYSAFGLGIHFSFLMLSAPPSVSHSRLVFIFAYKLILISEVLCHRTISTAAIITRRQLAVAVIVAAADITRYPRKLA